MEPKFLDKVKIKSKLRRTETFLRGRYNKKEWVINRFKHPKKGLVIGFRTVSNGLTEFSGGDDPIIYHAEKYIKVLLVVINEKQNPIYVLPEEVF